MKIKSLLFLAVFLFATAAVAAIAKGQIPEAMRDARAELLWPKGAPGALGDRPEDRPMLFIFLPEKQKAVGTGVCVCPGGGYGFLAFDHEGRQIARWFNSLGIAAFVVDYRHRRKGYGHPAPLQDALRAVRTVRARAEEFGVRPDRIGIMGFSAGGHLASTVITHFDDGNPQADDPVERVSSRPDFAILCYPVIAFGEPFTHIGSQRNLLGDNPDLELLRSLSSEKQVRPNTPPTFLFHTDEDQGVPPENSVVFYLALRKAGVPAELHIFRVGRHGIGLGEGISGTEAWPSLCEAWLRNMGFLPKK
ncbi:MAG: alpha/beta hydrolase [Thermoguttaceae bacterium]|nr:alpha/beta hydrolase [Thermoguttaceae bacterium]